MKNHGQKLAIDQDRSSREDSPYHPSLMTSDGTTGDIEA